MERRKDSRLIPFFPAGAEQPLAFSAAAGRGTQHHAGQRPRGAALPQVRAPRRPAQSTNQSRARLRGVSLPPRDADETKEWIEEKNQALNTDNYGHDLASVQALQRKHEGFERDLAALGDKVSSSPLLRSSALLCRPSRTLLLSAGEIPGRDGGAADPVAPGGRGRHPGEMHGAEHGVEQPGGACRPAQGEAGELPRPPALPVRLQVSC